nr:hypothetical protein CFP56_50450 [Quercus suber]
MSEKRQKTQATTSTNAQRRDEPAPQRAAASSTSASTQKVPDVPPYTDEEKQYIKKSGFADEFHFLRDHGLSIYNEEDREDGRLLLRQLMLHDDEHIDEEKENDEDDDEDGEDDDEDSFLAEIERDPSSHVADYRFSEAQLDWIKKHYRHSGNFMLSYGLKPWDDDDCKDGRRMVESMMRDGH